MSLVDLKSDLSKYRSEVSKEGKSSPEASSATSDKNFATKQPITDGLYKEVPTVQKPRVVSLTSQLSTTKLDDIKKPKNTNVVNKLGSTKLDDIKQPKNTSIVSKLDSTTLDDIVIPNEKRIQLEDRLTSTKQDDIVKNAVQNLLVNSVSQFSPASTDRQSPLGASVGLEQIKSKFSNVNITEFTSKLNESDTEINKTNPGENNNKSNVDVIPSKLVFDRADTSPEIYVNPNEATDNVIDPKTIINPSVQTFDREGQAVAINKDILSPIGNVTDPAIKITKPEQSIDRTTNLVEINKNILSPEGNIIVPEVKTIIPPLSIDRTKETPNIITDTIKEGLVVNPDTKILRVENGTNHFGDESQLNIDRTPIKFVGTSQLDKMVPNIKSKPIRYNGRTVQDNDNSELNLDGITPTVKGGRHEKPENSLYSVVGLQEVNYFSNQFAIGFTQKQQIGDTKFIGQSQYVWTGGTDNVSFTNFFNDRNASGFETFVNQGQSSYKQNSSKFSFTKTPSVDFFDNGKQNTLSGFTSFAPFGVTQYKTETSELGWKGKGKNAPTTDYFDLGNPKTTEGFTSFAVMGDSKYIPGSSILDWDGNSQQSPAVNYFDLTNASSTIGFHTFAGFMDSKYIPDSSVFDWDGNATQNAPAVDFLDKYKKFTTSGFHVFAQKYDSKYIPNSSEFDWNGTNENAPKVNYFDLTGKFTTSGFDTFVQTYDTKYIPNSSRFTWNTNRPDAPAVDNFDLTNLNTLSGFDTFTPYLESKYKKESSTFTWNTTKPDAPPVNYFDLNGQFATTGFHTFASFRDTKYIPDSSVFDWDGTKDNAPAVNYFDLPGKFTTDGFTTFAPFRNTKYIPESSQFDWDGARDSAPAVNYFDLPGNFTTTGFHILAPFKDSKYIKESSQFDWDGGRSSAPAVNYFDLQNNFTTTGFHILAPFKESKYIKESSEFDWDGGRSSAPAVNYFDLQKKFTTTGFHILAPFKDSKYIKESSTFDWDGGRSSAPEVNYFDLQKKFTTIGFHRLAPFKDSKYVKDSSEFTFTGKFPKAGVDYFDKEKLNQKGFTLNIQPKGTSKPPGTEYFHESSFYTFIGGKPTKNANWFSDANATGFTIEIKRNEGLPATEYLTESSRYGFKGSVPAPQSFFPDDNQNGFTIKIMPKGASNPDTEYKPITSRFDFDGPRPELQSFFPDTNQPGFTVDIMPKGSGRPLTQYLWETSGLTWKGSTSDAPVQDFLDQNKTFTTQGFHKFAELLDSKFVIDSSKFVWKGGRVNAPAINYFGLYRAPIGKEYIDVQQRNNTTQAGRGFQTFYTDKNITNYESAYSILSTESGTNKSIVLDKPVTNFFGFTPTKRDGFLPKMTASDGTLYPIISPGLKYDANNRDRLAIQTSRGSGGLRTERGEEFAPLSLGKRPWLQQGTLASLENQVPNIKTGANASSYLSKYKDKAVSTVSDPKYRGSYLARYGVEGKQLDAQYQGSGGVVLQFDQNATQGSGQRVAPFVTRGIQVKGKTTNEVWGGTKDLYTDIVDGDALRIGNWLKTPKGIAWEKKQSELYKQNPLVDGISLEVSDQKTRTYNKGSVLNTIKDGTSGKRELRIRHGENLDFGDLRTFDGYEEVAKKMNVSGEDELLWMPRGNAPTKDNPYSYKYNRLIALMSELLPSANVPLNADTSAQFTTPDVNRIIFRLSGTGGPNSGKSGDGSTDIRRASHPFLTTYNTSGLLPASYGSTARRETFFGPVIKNGGTETDNRYYKKITDAYDSANKKFDGLMTALSYILDGAKMPNDENGTFDKKTNIQPSTETLLKAKTPFNPAHILFSDRVRAVGGPGYTAGTDKILEKPPSLETPGQAPIKQYSTVAYNKLQKVKSGESGRSREYNDFRHDIHNLTNTSADNGTVPAYFSSDPKVMRYHKYNLANGFGFGEPGKPGVQKDLPFKSAIVYKAGNSNLSMPSLKSGAEFRGDRINIIDFKQKKSGELTENEIYEIEGGDNNIPGKPDLITFYFSSARLVGAGYGPAEAIVFRAAFDSITDNHKPSWNPVTYMGRGDPIYIYSSYERDVSFGFTIHIGSRDEMKATWRKLNYLASWTAPEYTKGGQMKAPLCRLNIGHLFRKTPGFINSLSYTFDNVGGTWETAQLKEDFDYNLETSKPGVLQLPKTIQVSCGFTVIGNYRPERNSVFYNLYDDNGDGLAPKAENTAVVNYFRTFDTAGGDNLEYNTFDQPFEDKRPAPVKTNKTKKDADAASDADSESQMDKDLITALEDAGKNPKEDIGADGKIKRDTSFTIEEDTTTTGAGTGTETPTGTPPIGPPAPGGG